MPTVGTLRITALIELCAALKRPQLDALARKRESLLPLSLKQERFSSSYSPKQETHGQRETHSEKLAFPRHDWEPVKVCGWV